MAGNFIETIDCYRDLGDDTWLNWLERYFIGGRRKLQIHEFHGIHTNNTTDSNSNSLNRYGNHTESSGRLSICRNVIIQRNIDELHTNDFQCKQNVQKNQRLPTISSILMAYHRAREKLESIADINEL